MPNTFVPKNSSNINSLTYNPKTKTLLASLGKDRKQYSYKDVPGSIYEQLKEADKKGESVGKLFNELVIKGGFKYERL